AVLIEHLGGKFPLWLAPEQLAILSVSEKHVEAASELYTKLREAGIRVVFDEANESLGKKIRAVKQAKLPGFVVVGDKEVESGRYVLEDRDGGKQELSADELVDHLRKAIESRSL